MKWKEFKKKLEEAGVKDNDDIRYIDTAFDFDLVIKYDENLGWCIY